MMATSSIDQLGWDYIFGYTQNQLQDKHGGRIETIQKRLIAQGISLRPITPSVMTKGRYTKWKMGCYVNEAFFDVIDTEQKAYWLGFIYADGSLAELHDEIIAVCIGLRSRDENHLQLFRHDIKSNHAIQRRSNAAVINVTSRRLAQGLIGWGLMPNKSLKIVYPCNLPNYLERHFIRGYVDGDGYWSAREGGLQFGVDCGSKPFLVTMQQRLLWHGITIHLNKKYKYWRLRIAKQKEVEKLFRYLYTNATRYLKPKLDAPRKIWGDDWVNNILNGCD